MGWNGMLEHSTRVLGLVRFTVVACWRERNLASGRRYDTIPRAILTNCRPPVAHADNFTLALGIFLEWALRSLLSATTPSAQYCGSTTTHPLPKIASTSRMLPSEGTRDCPGGPSPLNFLGDRGSVGAAHTRAEVT